MELNLFKNTTQNKADNQLYFSLFNDYPDGIVFVNTDSEIILDCNKAFQNILKLKKDELLKYKFWELFDPENQKYFKEFFSGNTKLYKPKSILLEMHSGESKLFFNLEASQFTYDKKNYTKFIFRDITKEKKLEISLNETEVLCETMFNSPAIAVCFIEEDNIISKINDVFEKVTGYGRSEIEGKKTWMDFISNEDLEKMKILHELRLKDPDNTIKSYEFKIITKKGLEKNIFITIDVIPGTKRSLATMLDITALRRSHIILKQSEKKFRLLAEESPNMIFINSNGKIVFANQKCEDIMGYKKEEFYSSEFDFKKLIAPEYVDLVLANFKKHLNNEDVKPIEYELLTKTGKRIPAIISTKLFDFEGTNSILGIVTDISAQKEARKIIELNEEKFRVAFKTYPEAAAINKLENGEFIDINEAFTKITGYSKKDIEGKTTLELNLWKNPADRDKMVSNLLKFGEINNFEAEFRLKDGSIVLGEFFAKIIEINNEKCLLSITRDITELKKTEKILKESEEKYRTLFESSTDGIVLHDTKGNIFDANAKAQSMFGYKRHELVGSHISILHPDDAKISDISKAAFNEVTTKGSVYFEMVFKRSDGTTFPAEVSSTMSNSSGKDMIIGIVRDISERKKTEELLREREEKFRSLVETSQHLIWQCDKEGRYTYLNKEWENVLGYKIEEMLGKKFTEFQNEEYASNDYNNFKKQLTGEIIRGHETVSIHRNGSPVNLLINALPIFNKDGKITGTQGTAYDITAQKKMLEALKTSEEQYRTLIEASNDAIYFLYNGKFEIINKRFTKLFGYTLEETNAPDFSFINLIAPESKKVIEEREEKINRGEAPSPIYQFTAINKNGEKIECEVSLSYMKYKDGVASQGIIRDITDRIKAEEQIRKLSRSVEQSPVSILITDTDGTIEYVNSRVETVTGYKSSELIGKNPHIFKSGKMSENEYKLLWEKIKKGEEWTGEFLNKKKNGELFWESAKISPIKNNQGETTHFLAVKEDITEKKKMTEDLIKAKENAEKAERLKSEFLAQISHEIRSPLNIILNLSTLIKEEISQEEEKKLSDLLDAVDGAGKRIVRTINSILNMSELQAGTYDFNFEQIDIHSEVLELLKNEYLHYAKSKNLNLIYQNNAVNSKRMGDKYSITHIFANLIDNAIKYTEKGEVKIILFTNANNNLQVNVSDTGIGIAENFIDEIFEPFRQQYQGYTRKFEGNGLGLALVKKYCELNRAEIKVNSKEGEGSIFSVEFKEPENSIISND